MSRIKFGVEKPHKTSLGEAVARTDRWMCAHNVPRTQVNHGLSSVKRNTLSLAVSICNFTGMVWEDESSKWRDRSDFLSWLTSYWLFLTCDPLESVKVFSPEFSGLQNENAWWPEIFKGPLLWHHFFKFNFIGLKYIVHWLDVYIVYETICQLLFLSSGSYVAVVLVKLLLCHKKSAIILFF